MTFYHFTSARHLPFILQEGRLRPTESNIDMLVENAGPPVVWLTDLPEIPADAPTTYLGLYPAKREVRFEVAVPAIRWTDWPYTSQMTPSWRSTFLNAAGGPEVAEHLFIWPSSIPRRRWVGVMQAGKFIV